MNIKKVTPEYLIWTFEGIEEMFGLVRGQDKTPDEALVSLHNSLAYLDHFVQVSTNGGEVPLMVALHQMPEPERALLSELIHVLHSHSTWAMVAVDTVPHLDQETRNLLVLISKYPVDSPERTRCILDVERRLGKHYAEGSYKVNAIAKLYAKAADFGRRTLHGVISHPFLSKFRSK